MVTKQQQLEFAAKHIEKWKSGYDFAVVEETTDGHLCVRWPSICTSGITKKEWQQERDRIAEMNAMTMQMCNIKPLERDKMQNEKSVITGGIYLSRNGFRFEVVDIAKAGSDCGIDMVVYVNLDATNDFPPGQKWVLESESFVSKFKLDGCGRSAPNNSWHERGELPPDGCECEFAPKSGGAWVKTTVIAITNQNVILLPNGESVEFVFRLSNVIFRPLRTEREKAIDEMSLLAIGCEKYAITRNAAKAVCELLYDSGYHR